jgi:CRP-like cAMP-binding protein
LEQKTFAARSDLFQPGDLANHFYFLLEGRVKTEALEGEKEWLIRNIFVPNEFFGLAGLVGQPTRREFARTLRTKTKVVVLNNADIYRLMEANFDFAQKILGLAAAQIRQVEQRSINHFLQPAPARLASFLIEQLEKIGQQTGPDLFYNSQLTQEEIGAYIGTGRQTVTEILTELKAKKILTYNWGKFWVHDLERLRELSV